MEYVTFLLHFSLKKVVDKVNYLCMHLYISTYFFVIIILC